MLSRFREFVGPAGWDLAVQWGIRIGLALLVLVVGFWIARRIAKLASRAANRKVGDPALANFVTRTVFAALAIVVIVGALDQLGVPTASLLAGLGAIGLGVGLALKDSLANLAAGVLIVVTRPFHAGDYVELGDPVQGGTVDRIDLLQTTLVTPDNRVIVLPNSQVMNQAVVNYDARPTRRLEIALSIAFEDDIGRGLRVVQETLAGFPGVLAEPAPQVVVQRLGADGVELAVRPWVARKDYWDVHSRLLGGLKAALQDAGITIPYPQRVMRLVQDRPPGASPRGHEPFAAPGAARPDGTSTTPSGDA